MAPSVRVLVVEGSAEDRRAIGSALTQLGIEVVEAETCAQAHALAAGELRLAFTALEFSDGTGYTVAEQLKQTSPSLPVVMLRAWHELIDIERAERSGVVDFLQKPVDGTALLTVLERWLDREVPLPNDESEDELSLGTEEDVVERDEEDVVESPSGFVAQAGVVEPPSAYGFDPPTGSFAGPPPAYSFGPPPAYGFGPPPASAAGGAWPAFTPFHAVPQVENLSRWAGGEHASLPRARDSETFPTPDIEQEQATIENRATIAGTPIDPVDCSVFCPPSPMNGDRFLVQVFAHGPADRERAEQVAHEIDVTAVQRGHKRLRVEIPREAVLHIELRSTTLTIENPVEELVWDGTVESVQFEVMVPWHHPTGQAILTVIVNMEGVPLGRIKFPVQVSSGSTTCGERLVPRAATGSAQRFSAAFASYASPDRAEVLRRVQVLRAIGLECFQDVMDLSPGERWERMLYRRIDECDLFLLFWSTHAKDSEWVLKEALYAMERQRGDDSAPPVIRPIPLEQPIPLPPPELSHLHFNDLASQLIAAEESLKRRRKAYDP